MFLCEQVTAIDSEATNLIGLRLASRVQCTSGMRGTAITILILTITSQVTQATVNLKDASLIKSWTDIDGSEVKTSHHITRSYNSRSLSTGRFGFGWCSNLDVDLVVRSESSIEIDFCTDHQVFSKNKNEWRSQGSVIKKGKNAYVVQRANGEILRFNLTGQLIEVRSAVTQFHLIYSSGSLVALSDRRNRLLHILSDSTSGRISQIKDGSRTLDYVYSDTDLVEVRYRDQSTPPKSRPATWFTQFHYDTEHNLIRLHHADGTRERFEYDSARDRLIGSVRRDGCRESYHYQIKTSENFVSSAFETCGDRERLLSQIEFFFQTNAAGESSLERIRTIAGGKTFETHFEIETQLAKSPKAATSQIAGGLE